jgi:hypothetical protein
MTKYKLLSILLLVIGISALFLTKSYTMVNATSSALLINFIMIPCVVVDGILCVAVFLSSNPKKIVIIQMVVLLILLYWFIDYVFIKR